ncbi:hypothetical protein ACHAQA_008406 [Verticillium albo-atrum]
MSDPAAPVVGTGDLGDVLNTLKSIQLTQANLVTAVESLSRTALRPPDSSAGATAQGLAAGLVSQDKHEDGHVVTDDQTSQQRDVLDDTTLQAPAAPSSPEQRSGLTSRIILTTYPKQSGINPLPMRWGNPDPLLRGPVVVSRLSSTLRRRNAVGAQ